MKPDIGELIKVSLPGEAPWVEVISHTEEGFMGRIENKLFNELSEFEKAHFLKNEWGTVKALPKLHDYKREDIIEFVYHDDRFIPKKEVEKTYLSDKNEV